LGYLSWWRKRRHQHDLAALTRTTDAVIASQPDLVVITGDLVHIGLHHEMMQLRPWLRELSQRTQVLLVPGNHDLYRRDSAASYASAWGDLPIFGSPLASHHGQAPGANPVWPVVADLADVRVIGLCSAYAAPWLKADGRIGKPQLAALERALASAGNRQTVIALHHPVTRTGVRSRKALGDAAALQALLQKYRVRAVLHGHLHDNLEYRLGETLCLCTAPAASSYKDERHTSNHGVESLQDDALIAGAPGRPHRPLPATYRTLEFGAADGSLSTTLHIS